MRFVRHMMLALALVGLAGCGDDDPNTTQVATGDVQVNMDFSRADSLFAAPFPSDDLLTSGHVDVSRFPNPNRLAIINQALALVARDADGFSLTSAVYFSLNGRIDATRLPSVEGSLKPDARAFLISINDRRKTPVRVAFEADGGPFGTTNQLALLPYQGVPLQPATRYAAVVCAELLDSGGRRLQVAPFVDALSRGSVPASFSPTQRQNYLDGYRAAADLSGNCTVAGLAVFTTGAPADVLPRFRTAALAQAPPIPGTFAANEIFDDYCVYSTTIEMPDYQQGTAPYPRSGGDWRVDAEGHPLAPHTETANLVVTIPRSTMPPNGFPTAVLVRAGAGGERPLVDRGMQTENGGPPIVPGSGPAQEFARVGYAGVQVDGPLGGLRNTTQADEQFLIFNVFNLAALRDNVRESALELSILARVLDHLQIDTQGCPGAPPLAKFDTTNRVLMGHSTGATMAPLAMAVESSFRAVVLSGEGGSYIENVLYKRKPAAVLPVANMLVRYTDRSLTETDPALNLVQWALEPADPPIYADLVVRNPRHRGAPAHVLMLQGIVDNYILPNIANVSSLSLGLDLAGPALDDPLNPALAGQTPILSVLPLSGRRQIRFPASCNVSVASGCATAVLVQHREDGIQDGHEVVFQTEPPKRQYRCFLKTLLGGTPTVPADTEMTCSGSRAEQGKD